MSQTAAPRRLPLLAWLVAATLLVAHVLTLGRYGIFRDEFYYLANGRHLAWGYVDHPPLVAALAWLIEHTLGTSVYALRAPMLLTLVGVLAVMAVLVRRVGGGGLAIAFAWLAFALSPHYLFTFHYLSMNAPEVLWWSLAALLLVRATEVHTARRPGLTPSVWPWLAFGLVIGLAALTKVSGFVWGAGLALGLLLSPARQHLRSPWPWAAVALAALLFAPHVAWQVAHDWPTAEFVRNAQASKIVALAPAAFLREQVMLLGPVGAVVALAGFVALALGRLPGGRVWAVAVAATVAVFLLQRSKAYYVMPAYPVLLVAGAVMLERWLRSRTAARRLTLGVMIAFGLLAVPLALPVLAPATLQAYMAGLGLTLSAAERHETGALPQHYADMFGWEGLADAVAGVVQSLSPEERASARIYAQNYGEAGALEYYGRSRGLPRVISGHNAYWHWGPGPAGDGVVVIVGGNLRSHQQAFADVQIGGRATCDLCMPYESDLAIFVARGLRRSLHEIWPSVKHFD